MGHILFYYFVKAGAIGGSNARSKLSSLTGVTSIQASFLPDSQEKVREFESAFVKIQAEFHGTGGCVNDIRNSKSHPLKQFLTIQTDIISQRHLYKHDVESVFHRFTEALVKGLAIDRGSIWLYNTQKTKIICKDLFVKASNMHSSNFEIEEKKYPKYFQALISEKTISASDVFSDSRTNEMTEDYLRPQKITSMLDVPIWINGVLSGVICNESHETRIWDSDEEDFVFMMSNLLAFFLESTTQKY